MHSHYKEIYDAAKSKNVSSLNEALKYASIDLIHIILPSDEHKLESIITSPISQLAIENNQEAVNFLLDQGAS